VVPGSVPTIDALYLYKVIFLNKKGYNFVKRCKIEIFRLTN
jgi:hypothetical protein